MAVVQGLRMVPVLRADGTFHARVVAARLGSEGIVTQLRGNVDGPYPMGSVEVLVTEDDLVAARELLLADDVESSFADDDEVAVLERGNGRRTFRRLEDDQVEQLLGAATSGSAS